jgi:hypothetical protein
MVIRPEIWRGRRCLMGAVDGDAAFISIIPDDLINDKDNDMSEMCLNSRMRLRVHFFCRHEGGAWSLIGACRPQPAAIMLCCTKQGTDKRCKVSYTLEKHIQYSTAL